MQTRMILIAILLAGSLGAWTAGAGDDVAPGIIDKDLSAEKTGMKNTEAKKVIRQAVGGGRWFPGSRRSLDGSVGEYIQVAKPQEVAGRIVGAIAPHAGYQYSGPVAGWTFRAIQDNAKKSGGPETVVVLGFTHRASFKGVALMDGDAIETPIGEAALDVEAGELLTKASPMIFFNYEPHDGEHSAENEIPFVQKVLPDAKLVLGLMGHTDEPTIDAVVMALGKLAEKRKILVVASADMLHDADYELVTKTDKATLEVVKTMNHARLLKEWSPGRQVFCGIGPVAVVMRSAAAQGCRQGTVLTYRNSGDDYPESRGNWVVGYGAVVFAVP